MSDEQTESMSCAFEIEFPCGETVVVIVACPQYHHHHAPTEAFETYMRLVMEAWFADGTVQAITTAFVDAATLHPQAGDLH